MLVVVALLTQIRNIAVYSKIKLKMKWTRLSKVFTKREISATWKLFSTKPATLLKLTSVFKVNFEHISYLVLVFLSLTLRR